MKTERAFIWYIVLNGRNIKIMIIMNWWSSSHELVRQSNSVILFEPIEKTIAELFIQLLCLFEGLFLGSLKWGSDDIHALAHCLEPDPIWILDGGKFANTHFFCELQIESGGSKLILFEGHILHVFGLLLIVQVIDQQIPCPDFQILWFFAHVVGHKNCEILLVVLPKIIRNFCVDNKTISIIFVLYHIDNFAVFCLRYLFFAPFLLIECQVVGKRNYCSFPDHYQRGQAQRRQPDDNPVLFHEVVHSLIVGEILVVLLQNQFMHVIYEIHCLFEIFHYWILWDLLRILHLLVVNKGFMEMDIPFAHAYGGGENFLFGVWV